MKSKRQVKKEQRRRKQRLSIAGWGVMALAVVAFAGIITWNSGNKIAAPQGQTFPIMADTSHVQDGTDPGPYNSDPPTSGRHYPTSYEARFFEENEGNVPYPTGYLVHNLEHGYIIFWYNCAKAPNGDCEGLKSQIRSVLESENYNKVIAYPWPSLDAPVVLTSWGRMLKFDTFDPKQAQAYVQENRNKAPEPNAP